MRLPIALAAAAAALLLVAIPSAPAAKRGDAPFALKVGASKDGKFAQTKQVTLPAGEKRDYFFRLKLKPGNEDHGVFFDDAFTTNPHPEGYRVQWYKNGENVSSEVKGDGVDLTLKANKPKYFQVKVKAVTDNPPIKCVSGGMGDLEHTVYAFLHLNGSCP